MRYVLGSASPRRKELFARLGVPFTVCVSEQEETVPEGVTPGETVLHLSRQKAHGVALAVKEDMHTQADLQEPTVVLGADTVVALDERILGKPKDNEDAFRMLSALSGRRHAVYTGVTVVKLDSEGNIQDEYSFYEETGVYFDTLSEEEIWNYIASGEVSDKAGGYGIQGLGGCFIRRIEGDYYNVVGLPLSACYRVLKERGLLH